MDNPHKQVHDLLFDVWTQDHEFPVHAMQNGFQVVPFARIFWVKKFKETIDEIVGDMASEYIVFEVHGQDEFQK